MSEAIEGSNVGLSSEPVSTEIGSTSLPPDEFEVGSGNIEKQAREESGLREPIEGQQAQEIDEAAQAVEDAIEEGASEEVVQDLIRKYKIKVDGQEKEVQLDLSNEEDIIRRLQMAEKAQKEIQRAAEMEKRIKQSVEQTIEDPWAYLEELGFDVDKLAEERIDYMVRQLEKTPEQLEQEARDRELEELRQKVKKEEEARKNSEFQRLQEEARVNLDQQITGALSSTTDLPKSPYVVKRIADAMLTAMENGKGDVSPEEVIPWVQREINEELQSLFDAMPDNVLEQFIGNNTIERLRKKRLSKMNAQTISNVKETGKSDANTRKEEKKPIKMSDWLRHGSSLKDL
jgi:hypothetical protein